MKKLLLLCMFLCPVHALAGHTPMVFGEGGQIKMLYDQRQRPQAVYLNDKVHIVYNGGGKPGGVARKTETMPMAVTYDPQRRAFSTPITLGEGSDDHHDGPIVWADMGERLANQGIPYCDIIEVGVPMLREGVSADKFTSSLQVLEEGEKL